MPCSRLYGQCTELLDLLETSPLPNHLCRSMGDIATRTWIKMQLVTSEMNVRRESTETPERFGSRLEASMWSFHHPAGQYVTLGGGRNLSSESLCVWDNPATKAVGVVVQWVEDPAMDDRTLRLMEREFPDGLKRIAAAATTCTRENPIHLECWWPSTIEMLCGSWGVIPTPGTVDYILYKLDPRRWEQQSLHRIWCSEHEAWARGESDGSSIFGAPRSFQEIPVSATHNSCGDATVNDTRRRFEVWCDRRRRDGLLPNPPLGPTTGLCVTTVLLEIVEDGAPSTRDIALSITGNGFSAMSQTLFTRAGRCAKDHRDWWLGKKDRPAVDLRSFNGSSPIHSRTYKELDACIAECLRRGSSRKEAYREARARWASATGHEVNGPEWDEVRRYVSRLMGKSQRVTQEEYHVPLID